MLDLQHTWRRARAWLTGSTKAPSFTDAYDAVYARLDPETLRADDADLDDVLFHLDRRAPGILGFYSAQGLEHAFEAYGFFDLLRARGFEPRLHTASLDADHHRLRIYDGDAHPDRLLVELVLWVERLTLPDGFTGRFLLINWLQMQDPRATFPPGRRPLPDQQHPGLGLFREFSYLLRLTAQRLGCDGLLNHPSHPHNGVLYGKVCRFVDPVAEGRLRALVRDVGAHDLAALTEDVEGGRVVDALGRRFVWDPAPQVLATSPRAQRWFQSAAYRATVDAVTASTRLHRVGEPHRAVA